MKKGARNALHPRAPAHGAPLETAPAEVKHNPPVRVCLARPPAEVGIRLAQQLGLHEAARAACVVGSPKEHHCATKGLERIVVATDLAVGSRAQNE